MNSEKVHLFCYFKISQILFKLYHSIDLVMCKIHSNQYNMRNYRNFDACVNELKLSFNYNISCNLDCFVVVTALTV